MLPVYTTEALRKMQGGADFHKAGAHSCRSLCVRKSSHTGTSARLYKALVRLSHLCFVILHSVGSVTFRLVLKGDVRVPRQGKRQFPVIKSCRAVSLSLPTAIVHLKLILPRDRKYSVGG